MAEEMKQRVAIVTDSNSGITQSIGEKLGIYVLPMPFFVDEKLYLEDITLSQEKFYQFLEQDAQVHTSQPTPTEVTKLWDQALQVCEEVVYIPMSSGLSGSCESAMLLAGEYGGKVQVVDNQRISVTMKQSVFDAIELAKAGNSAAQIKSILEQEKLEASIYITVDTLKYLKKGGRITPAGALLGEALNIKPVLTIQGEKLDAYSKVRGLKKAKKVMLKAIEGDLKKRFRGKDVVLAVAYSSDEEAAVLWKKELEEAFPGYEIFMDKLSLSVACHIGAGALAVAVCKKALWKPSV